MKIFCLYVPKCCVQTVGKKEHKLRRSQKLTRESEFSKSLSLKDSKVVARDKKWKKKNQKKLEVNVCITKKFKEFHFIEKIERPGSCVSEHHRNKLSHIDVVWQHFFGGGKSCAHNKKLRFVFRYFLSCGKSICSCLLYEDAVYSLRSHFVEWDCNIEYNLHIMAYPVRSFHQTPSPRSATRTHIVPHSKWYFVRLVASVVPYYYARFFLFLHVLLPLCVCVAVLLPLSFSVECNLLRCMLLEILCTRCVDINMNAINLVVHTSHRQYTSQRTTSNTERIR